MRLPADEGADTYRDSRQTNLAGQQRQLPPLHNIVGYDCAVPKTKFEESWDTPSSSFIDYTGGSAESTSTAASPVQATSACMPILSQPFEDVNFRVVSDKNLDSSINMLSSSAGWGSGSQYSTGTSSYPSSTSSAQSYYSNRPTMVTSGRSQQNLPSLTEMNLNNAPGYASRPSHNRALPHHHNPLGSPLSTTPYFNHTTDALEISYTTSKPTLTSPYNTPYNTFTPRSAYNHNTQYGSNMEPYTPAIETYAYSNGHSWPPSLPYPSTYPNMSDASSISSGRRRRGNLPKHVTDILRAWFHDHLDHPYPTDEDKQMLIGRTNLTISQISNWFINARRRHWPQLKAERERTLQVQGVGYKNPLGKP